MKKLIVPFYMLVLCCTGVTAQEDLMQRFDNRLAGLRDKVSIKRSQAKTIKFPRRTYDSPMFCNEFIRYKHGFIINGLSISPGGKTNDVHYNFVYFDTITKKLYKLTSTLTDSIESLIEWKGAIYISGKKNGQSIVAKFDAGGTESLSTSINEKASGRLGKELWIKLGVYNEELMALEKNGLFVYRKNNWTKIFDRPFPAVFYLEKHKDRYPLIPTENIRLAGNHLYFLQEITQERSANLFLLDLQKDSCASEFFISHQLDDNSKKEIMSYWVTEKELWVSILRLMNDVIVLQKKDGKILAPVINNQLTTRNGDNAIVRPTAVMKYAKDTLLFAGADGLFTLTGSEITQLCSFTNSAQDIKFKDGSTYTFEFVPRCIEKLDREKFLLGGLWGGLYILDMTNGSMQCVDNLKKELAKLDLLALAMSTD